MNNINSNPAIINPKILNEGLSLGTTLLSDANGNVGALDYDIKSVTKSTEMVGTAITVDVPPGDNLYLHQAIYNSKNGYVIIVDGKNHKSNAYLGELMAHAAEALEINGIVIDGLVRDFKELKKINIPIFARGFIPNGPQKEGGGKINRPISCGGVKIRPGDLIVGDDDGVIALDPHNISEIFDKAKKKQKYEQERLLTIEKYIESKGENNRVSILPEWLITKGGE